MGSAYIGALSYADDITLLCPSIRGLNKMIVLCCEYAKEFDITFNGSFFGLSTWWLNSGRFKSCTTAWIVGYEDF